MVMNLSKLLSSTVLCFLFVSSSFHRILADPLWKDVCTQDDVKNLPFCDTSISIEDRVDDYVDRVPTEAIPPMMIHTASGYEPLHIPYYQWWSEGLHGPLQGCVRHEDQCACPTSFPCPSALGNAFNITLYHAIGEAIGSEGRAISNLRQHKTGSGPGDGLTYWSPTLNMQRDPRWGRNQEVPGEDPHLTSQYVSAFVNGLQGDGDDSNPSKLRVAAACKHFVANSLEKWNQYSRHDFDAHVSQQDLEEYYFPPFQECVQKAAGVMCSYNALNGQPTCANDWLLQDVLRKRWNFNGYITSDCGALGDIVTGHHFAVDPIQASAMAVNASVDLNCGNPTYYPNGLAKAFEEKWVEESTIRDAFTRLARIQFRLGLFDQPKEYNPENDIRVVDSHNDLALDAAQQSIVLLKNKGDVLPLQPKQQKLVLIGPHIRATEVLLSNYHGERCGCSSGDDSYLHANECIQTPLDAIEEMNQQPVVAFVKGCNVEGKDLDEIKAATEAAKSADVVILIAGLDLSQEREGLDRTQSTLPGLQPALIESVLRVAPKKTILVLFHGGSVSLGDFVLDSAQAIVSMPYGGQAASKALASVLFGEYNPTGRLSATMYPPSYVQSNPLTEMGLRPKNGFAGRTHMYYNGPTEFSFGDGLSYSKWGVEWSSSWQQASNEEGALTSQIDIAVSNLGPVAGSQNVLLFWKPPNSTDTLEKLLSFQGTSYLQPDETQVLQFQIQEKSFALWNNSKQMMEILTEDRVLVAKVSGAEATFTLHASRTDMADVTLKLA